MEYPIYVYTIPLIYSLYQYSLYHLISVSIHTILPMYYITPFFILKLFLGLPKAAYLFIYPHGDI